MRTRWGTSTSLDKGNQNSLLIKAIQLYVHHNYSLQLKSAIIDLASLDERGRDDIFGFSSLLGGSSNETLAGQLRYYRIVQKPPMNAWHNVGTYGKPAASVDVLIYEYEERGHEVSSPPQSTLILQILWYVVLPLC